MIAGLLAYKGVILPVLVGVLAWWHGRFARAASDKQAQIVAGERKADSGDSTDLDELP